ncbi:hypothetical protein, partial [Bacillus thuringiensis]|uniref:hypothetical protein n=1 Tax=Bacillus thuringiensis TaxID=1428 RepID=UPI001C54D1E0
ELAMVFPPSVPSRYRFTACILSFEENLAIKNAPPIVNYVSNNWGALQFCGLFLLGVSNGLYLFIHSLLYS